MRFVTLSVQRVGSKLAEGLARTDDGGPMYVGMSVKVRPSNPKIDANYENEGAPVPSSS